MDSESVVPVAPYPLIDFPVFGLDGDWGSGCWLEMIEGSSTEIAGLTLGHGSRHRPVPNEPWAWLTSWRLRALDRWTASPDRLTAADYSRLAAEDTLFRLFDVTTPRLASDEYNNYTDNTMRVSADLASRYTEWPVTSWTVAGERHRVHFYSWANAWSGFLVTDDIALVLTAVGISPHRVHLHRLTGATSYNFDLSQRLAFPASIVASQQLAPVSNKETRTDWPRHSDHDALLTVQ